MCLSNRLEGEKVGNVCSSYVGGNINKDDLIVYFWNLTYSVDFYLNYKAHSAKWNC